MIALSSLAVNAAVPYIVVMPLLSYDECHDVQTKCDYQIIPMFAKVKVKNSLFTSRLAS